MARLKLHIQKRKKVLHRKKRIECSSIKTLTRLEASVTQNEYFTMIRLHKAL